MATHRFSLKGKWSGGLMGSGTIEAGNLKGEISVPSELKGPGRGTNPEEMLLGAAATCYLITLAAILEHRKIPVAQLELSSEAEMTAEGASHKFLKIIHRPAVALSQTADPELKETVRIATERAEKACMVSNALRGNVTVTVEPQITSL
jgi:peroxiredoxin-like protein